jgi:hypothetical protein
MLPSGEEDASVVARSGPRILIAALAGLAVGAGMVAAWPRGPATSQSPAKPADDLRAQIAQLREDLVRETFARQVLESRLALLEHDGWASEPRAPAGGSATGEPGEDEPAEAGDGGAVALSTGGRPAAAADSERGARPWFDETALAELGMSDSEIESLREIWEQHVLQRAYLRDEAMRDGYNRRRQRNEQIALEASFREEIGDDTYDRMLYATGQNNRAVVRDVLSRSPANASGIESGDVIWRYDGNLILRPGELQRATAAGRPGELVPVELVRDGELVRLFVPRGPLGVLLLSERVSPSLGG